MSPDAIITFPLFGEDFILNLPRFFTIFGFNIYYYGLFVTAGYALAGVYLIKRKKLFGLSGDNILDLVLIALICGLVGARLYYMLFNFGNYFGPGQWGNIIRFRDGGLAVYGGIIASGLGFMAYSRIKKLPLGSLLDVAGFGLFIGQAIGRWGNFFNREAYGVDTDLPWKMGLTSEGITTYVHPAFLYEALWNTAGFLIIHIFSKKSKTKYPGQYFLFYVAWYGLGRFIIEGLRTDSLMIPGTDLRASQLLAAATCLAAVIILFVNFLRGKEVLLADGDALVDDDSEAISGENAEIAESEEDAQKPTESDEVSEDDVSDKSKDKSEDDNTSDEKSDDEKSSSKSDEDDKGKKKEK